MTSPALDIACPVEPASAKALASTRFDALDGWRGVFALVVVLYHFMTLLESPLKGWRWLQSGYLMVDVFFVLSGFVIAHAYADRLRSPQDVGIFMLRRFFRVWPLHALVLLGLLLLETVKWYMVSRTGVSASNEAFAGMYSWDGLAASVFLVHALGLFDAPVWNVPSWSISTEFYTYLVFALLVCVAGAAWLVRLSMVIVTGILLFLLQQNLKSMDITVDQGFLRCVMGFFTGVLAYRAATWLSLRRPGWSSWISALQLPALIAVMFFLWLVNNGPLGLYAPLVFLPFIIVFARDEGLLARLMTTPVMAFLGRISYSVYLVHYLVMVFLIRVLMLLAQKGLVALQVQHGELGFSLAFAQPWQTSLFMALSMMLIIVVSAMTYYWLELPMQAVGKRCADRVRRG